MVINIQDDILRLRAIGLLEPLLKDKATRGNILWATNAYTEYGEWFHPGNEIHSQWITGDFSDLIKTRARRAMEQRTERTRQHAEVFTPLWVVKKMNDYADEQWFGRKDGICRQFPPVEIPRHRTYVFFLLSRKRRQIPFIDLIHGYI